MSVPSTSLRLGINPKGFFAIEHEHQHFVMTDEAVNPTSLDEGCIEAEVLDLEDPRAFHAITQRRLFNASG